MKLTGKKIIKILEDFIINLDLKDFAVFVGGSFFFLNKAHHNRFINGESDIDTIIVCKKNTALKKTLEKLFDKKVLKKFLNGEYSILNYSYSYGKKRNVLHIKFMSYKLFKDITNLNKLSFKSFRKKSLLKKKKSTLFFSNNANPIIFSYIENKINYGFLLDYKFNPIQHQKFFLSDVHSLILFSMCMFDSIKASDMRVQFLLKIKKYVKKTVIAEDLKRMFQYFYKKGHINDYWQKILLMAFNNEKDINLLYYQDLCKKKSKPL
ncbi:hypothetical protein ACFL1Y_00470 [Patescibacteria group bacterium]